MRIRENPAILHKKTARWKGQSVMRLNLLEASAILNKIQGMLGPRGLYKIILHGHLTAIVSDAVKLLNETENTHPIGKILAEASKGMYNQFNDGTTSLIILTCGMLKEALKVIDIGLKPATIFRGYRLAEEKAEKTLNSMVILKTDFETLKNIARSSTNQVPINTLPNVIVEAVYQFYNNNHVTPLDRERIKFIHWKGGSLKDAYLVKGTAIKTEKLHPEMPIKICNAKIALIDFPLSVQKPRTNLQIKISKSSQYENFYTKEHAIIGQLIESIATTGANVVFCKKGVGERSGQYFAQHKILATRRVTSDEFEFLSKTTGGEIIGDPYLLSSSKLGEATLVEERKLGNTNVIFVECEHPKAVTIVVPSSNDAFLEDYEIRMRHAIGAVSAAMADGKVIPGGGATELAISDSLRRYALEFSSKEQFTIQAFANAIELIPFTLMINSGFNPMNLIPKIRELQEKQQWYGFDAITGKVEDVVQRGILDVYNIKLNMLRVATETAIAILRVDDIVFLPNLSEEDLRSKGFEKIKP